MRPQKFSPAKPPAESGEESPDGRGGRRSRRRFSDFQTLLYPVAGRIILAWVWAVNRFVKIDRRGPAFEFIREGKPFIFTFWHEDCFPLMFEMSRGFRRNPPVFMVSLGRTGSLGAYLLKLFNVDSVAGSGSKKGVRAVRRLAKRSRRRSESVYILADGSRGPNKELRWGALYLAKDAGIPVIAGRSWGTGMIRLGWTWMRLILPLPWGRHVVLTSEPLYVPADADKDEMQRCREELQQRLDELSEASVDYCKQGKEVADRFGPPIEPFPVPPGAGSDEPD